MVPPRERASSRTVEHVGEWRIVTHGDTPGAVFADVAAVIARAIEGRRARAGTWEEIAVDAPDRAGLLVNWANELIGLSEAGACAYDATRDVVVAEREGRWWVTASARARAVDGWRSPLKAATYHGVSLVPAGTRWRAELLMDV
jgi:SHS2 domain-containing protein